MALFDHRHFIERVGLFNICGQNIAMTPDHPDYVRGLTLQNQYCRSEVEELEDNLLRSKCTRDDYADILFVLYGAAFRAGLEKEFLEKIETTITKTCASKDPRFVAFSTHARLNRMDEFLESGNYDAYLHEIVEGVLHIEAHLEAMGLFKAAEDLDLVCDANIAKYDKTMEDAVKSQEAYAAKGISVEIKTTVTPQGFYYPVVSDKHQVVNGKEYANDKILKSHTWAEPVFEPYPVKE